MEKRPREAWRPVSRPGVLGLLVLGPLLLATAGPERASAGAWTQAGGTIYCRLAAERYLSRDEFDPERERRPLPFHGEFTDVTVKGYVEYGITDRFTALGSFAVKSLRHENDIRVTKTLGIGDFDLGIRTRLASGSAGVTAFQLLAKVPSAYDTDVLLPLGSGEPEYGAHLLWGRSLWPLLPGYLGLEAGYRWRSGAPEDELRYLAEAGSDLGGSFYARAKLDGVRGRGSAKTLDVNGNPTVRNSYDLGTLDVTAGRRFGAGLFLETGFATALYGRTTPSGSRLSLAVAWRTE